MAIAYDNSANSTSGGGSTNVSFSYTTSGSDRIIFLGIFLSKTLSGTPAYGGVSMTQIGTTQTINGFDSSFWYLIAPASGANNVTFSLSSSGYYDAVVSSYTGVSQTGQPDASATNAQELIGTSYSKAVTTTADNCWAIMVGTESSQTTLTAGSNTVKRQQNAAGNGAFLVDTNSAKTPAGTDTLAFTFASGTRQIGSFMASFKPVSTANTSNFLAFM